MGSTCKIITPYITSIFKISQKIYLSLEWNKQQPASGALIDCHNSRLCGIKFLIFNDS